MSGLIDIHAHFVYGVDDGARTEETMKAMLDAAHADGVTALFATSHATPGMEPFPQEVYSRHLDAARRYCADKGYDLTLYPGAEILYTPALETPAREHTLPTLADSQWVLMEYLPTVSAKELEAGLDLAAWCGYSVLLAHIERYACLEKGRLPQKLRGQYPVRFQVNCSTVLDPGGFFRRRRVDSWFREGVIDAVASDMHNTASRPMRMRAAYDALARRYGESAADSLTGHNDWMRAIIGEG